MASRMTRGSCSSPCGDVMANTRGDSDRLRLECLVPASRLADDRFERRIATERPKMDVEHADESIIQESKTYGVLQPVESRAALADSCVRISDEPRELELRPRPLHEVI